MELRPVTLPFEKISILQDVKNQGISSDSEFLYKTIVSEYSVAVQDKSFSVIELGTGNGITAIMLALTFKDWQISALEAQISLYLLARKNVDQSGTNINLYLADLRKVKQFLPGKSYDLVLANPPYYQITDFRISSLISRSISRNEILCNMDDLLASVKCILRPQGRGFILYPAARSAEFKSKAADYGFRIINKISDSQYPVKENKSKTLFIIGPKTNNDIR